jgi:hypothetical protein
MNLLRIGNYLINPQCIARVLFNTCYSEAEVCLSCSSNLVKIEEPCLREYEGKIEIIDTRTFSVIGEDAKALKRYLKYRKMDP